VRLVTARCHRRAKLLVASSITDFLGWYADELERGNFHLVIDRDPPIIEQFGIKEPAYHFHDAARQLRRAQAPFASRSG
jgi:hypothetical protein